MVNGFEGAGNASRNGWATKKYLFHVIGLDSFSSIDEK
jgi:hypothetical protein